MSQTPLFFMALLPPQAIQDEVTRVKQHFADRYASRGALRSPPHITLQPPFIFDPDKISTLALALQQFATNFAPVTIQLAGFAAFPPRVIFINVLTTPALLTLQRSLADVLEKNLKIVDPQAKLRPFTPHLTVAFRDLTPPNFAQAWEEFRDRPYQADFAVDRLTLLRHDRHCWTVHADFPLRRELQAEP
jgi:2'-5' RNA ligase